MEATKGDLRPIENNKKYVMSCHAVVSLERDVDGCGLATWEGGSLTIRRLIGLRGNLRRAASRFWRLIPPAGRIRSS